MAEIHVPPPEGSNLASTHTAEYGQEGRNEYPSSADGVDQRGGLRHIVSGYPVTLHFRWINGLGRVAGQQLPSHGLGKSLFQHSVNMMDRAGDSPPLPSAAARSKSLWCRPLILDWL